MAQEVTKHFVHDTGNPVTNAQNLQNLISAGLNGGDIIVLDNGAEYRGGIQIDYNPGTSDSNRVILRSAAIDNADSHFPAGIRILDPRTAGTTQQALMPKITCSLTGYQSGGYGALWTQLFSGTNPAANWLLQGIEFRCGMDAQVTGTSGQEGLFELIYIGNNGTGGPYVSSTYLQNAASKVPSNITFDRCMFWSGFPGPQGQTIRVGIGVHGNNILFTECLAWDFKTAHSSTDCQALSCNNCFGPITLNNCYFEGATECIIFGGSQVNIVLAQPDTITIKHCLLEKNPAWNPLNPAYDGSRWATKNVLEFKSGTNIVVDDVTIQNSWPNIDQRGHGMVITMRGVNSSQGNYWTQVANVTITNLHIKNCYQGWEMFACDDYTAGSGVNLLSHDVVMRDVLHENVWDHKNWGQFDTNLVCADNITAGTPQTFHPTLAGPGVPGYTGASIVGMSPSAAGNFQNAFRLNAGDVIVLDFPADGGAANYNPRWERLTVTSVNVTSTQTVSGHTFTYGTFTATPTKAHNGTSNPFQIGCESSEEQAPWWMLLFNGWQPVANTPNNLDKITVEHVTVTTARADGYGRFFALGNGFLFFNSYYMTNMLWRNNVVPTGSIGMFEIGEAAGTSYGNPAIPQGSGYPNAFSELDAATRDLRNNLIYRTSLGSPIPAAGYMAASAGADTCIYKPLADASDVGFTTYNGGVGGNYQLTTGSAGHNAATDGTDIGNRTWTWHTDGGGAPASSTATTTTLTSTQNPSLVGQPVAFNAVIAGAGGIPTGTVQFKVDGVNYGGPVSLVPGTSNASAQSQTTSTLTNGNHAITATYSGDSNFLASNGSLTQAVSVSLTVTELSSANPSLVGDLVVFTAQVMGTGPAPTGLIQFQIDGQTIGSGVTLVNGTASVGISTLTAGTHNVAALYSGDPNYGASQTSITQIVRPKAIGTDPHGGSIAPFTDFLVIGNPITGTGAVVNIPPKARTMLGFINVAHAPGGAGQVIDVFFQNSTDNGANWHDIAHVKLTTLGTAMVPISLVGPGPTVAPTPNDGTLAAGTIVQGPIGGVMRAKYSIVIGTGTTDNWVFQITGDFM